MRKLQSRREYSQRLLLALQVFPHLFGGQSVWEKGTGDLGKEEAGSRETSEEAADTDQV